MSSTKEQVAAMAYSTGERLKSSAVELLRGLESSLQSREQLEIALAKMFGSCTGDFGKNGGSDHHHPHEEDHDDDDGLPGPNSTLSSERESTLGAAPLRREVSNSSSRRKSSKASRRSTKQLGNSGSSSSSSSNSCHRERRQARADYGEHIYAQLFMDDQKRAAQAVSSLRETAVARAPPAAASGSPSAVATNTKNSPFPVSSPPRSEVKVAPLSSNEVHIPRTLTFDDGISAISQHTLDVMEDRVDRVRSTKSTDSSLWSSLKESKTPPLPTPTKRTTTPPTMPRVRSAQSKASRQSRTSHTTHTSDTSSFQNLWQQEEQRYWNTQVEQDSRKSRKSRNGSVQKTSDHTLPTMESSFSDVWGSPLRPHPHDASPLARDPDRIGAVFIVPHTEMAEI